MRKQNKLIFFNNTIYGLAKDYGFKCDLYRPAETLNLDTGMLTKTRQKHKIKKAIFFPSQLYRDYNYAALFGKDIQFGGILDSTQRRILINKKWLPKDFKVQVTDYLIFDHVRYEIQKIDEMELADYWHLVVKEIKGQVVAETYERKIKDQLTVSELLINVE